MFGVEFECPQEQLYRLFEFFAGFVFPEQELAAAKKIVVSFDIARFAIREPHLLSRA